MPELNDFATALAADLGVAEIPIDVDAVLSLAADAAHSVMRPAAPLTTFLVGLAAGRAGATAESISEATATAREHFQRLDR
jgi:hypothetical protein